MDPQDIILETATAYWKSEVLFTALDLGIFGILENGAVSAADLADTLAVDRDGLGRLLLALRALGLLTCDGQRYSLPETLSPYLTPRGARSLFPSLVHMAHLREKWARLGEAVRSGGPLAPEGPVDDEIVEEKTEAFMAAMEGLASNLAESLVSAFPLRGDEKILDLGCGPGTFVRRFLEHYSDVQATVVDMEDVIPITRRHMEREGRLDRVTFLSGDLRHVPLSEGYYDVVLLSNVMHIFGPEDVRRIVRRIFSVLRPKGAVLINDFFTDATGTEPAWGALFSLNMLIHTEGGRNYRLDEGETFLREAGFSGIHARPLSASATLLVGHKS